MLGKQARDERIYLSTEDGGRGLKAMYDAYKETRQRVAATHQSWRIGRFELPD